jgi:N-methylhydantoinase A
VFEGLREELDDALDRDGVAARTPVRYEADVRFERQGAELTVELAVIGDGTGGATMPDLDGLAERFVADYVTRFGPGAVAMGVGVEVMTLRVIGSEAEAGDALGARSPTADARRASTTTTKPAAVGHRTVRIERTHDALVPVHDVAGLASGSTLSGPALVDAGDTTVWVGPGRSAVVDDHGSLLIGEVR